MNRIYLTRTEAAEVLDRIRELAALARQDRENGIVAIPLDAQIEHYLAKAGGGQPRIRSFHRGPEIPALEACPGEAHKNPWIDHCAQCMPRWGLVGPRVVIK